MFLAARALSPGRGGWISRNQSSRGRLIDNEVRDEVGGDSSFEAVKPGNSGDNAQLSGNSSNHVESWAAESL